MCSDRISCVEKLLISPKLILIKFGNGFVHQTSHVFSFNGILHNMRQTAYFADVLAAGQNAVHDFDNNLSRYFLQIWQYDPLSASISNDRKSATYLKSPLGFCFP